MSSDRPFLERAATWACNLRWRDVPPPVRRAAGAQRLGAVGAAAWTLTFPDHRRLLGTVTGDAEEGSATLLGLGPTDPETAAVGNATLAAALGYDDGLLGGWTGRSAVFVPLAYAEANGEAWRRAILGHVAANEVAARVGSAAALGPFDEERAAYVHAVAAVVGRGVVEGDDPETLADAMALALSQPSWPLEPPSLDADPGTMVATPVRAGLDAVETARAGVDGTRDVLEREGGFLDTVAGRGLSEYLDGLGSRWHTATLSSKAHPTSVPLAPVVEATLDARRLLPHGVVEVRGVSVEASAFTLRADERARPYDRGPDTPLGALSNLVGYNVAVALLDGEHTPRQLRAGRRGSREVWELAERVRLGHDGGFTARALSSPLPPGGPITRLGPGALPAAVGAVGVGPALGSLPALLGALRPGPLPEDLSRAERSLGARVTLTFDEGETVTAECAVPSGFAGRPLSERRAVARRKCEAALRELAGESGSVRRRVDDLREPTGVASLARVDDLRRAAITLAP